MSIDYIARERQIQRRANLALRYLRTAERLREQAEWGLIPKTDKVLAQIGEYIAQAHAIACALNEELRVPVPAVPSGDIGQDIRDLACALKPLA